MKKTLLIGTFGLFAMLVVLWIETRADSDEPARPAPTARAARIPQQPTRVEGEAPRRAAAAKPAEPVAALAPSADGKVNPNSDEFFDRYVERQPKMVSRAMMSCYAGHEKLSMDAWIKVTYVGHIKDGEMTFTNVVAKESRLGDPALEACMLEAVRKAHYHDDSLPDTESYPDQVVLNPERGGKKYMHVDDE